MSRYIIITFTVKFLLKFNLKKKLFTEHTSSPNSNSETSIKQLLLGRNCGFLSRTLRFAIGRNEIKYNLRANFDKNMLGLGCTQIKNPFFFI